ncbi:MAG: YdcF family protein, partial [Olsenella sp.]|nr:YdcF family protein [Olsenella sp.]
LAASLLAGHPERQAILSGGALHSTDAENDGSTEADVMRTYLLERGVPSEKIVLERRATNTWQNIEYSLALAKGLGHSEGMPEGASEGTATRASKCAGTRPQSAREARQLCVVSNDYHLYRAIRCGGALGVALVGCGARTPLRSWPQQWCREVLTILAGR